MKVIFSIFLLIFSQFLGAQQNASPRVEIKNIGTPVNSTFSDFAPLISADGSTMVFTSLRPTDKPGTSPTPIKKDGQKKETNATIYITYYDDKSKTWLEPIMLESVINLAGVDNSAIALSNDGQKMLIYRGGNNKNINKGVFETTLKGNEWSVPKRVPAPINSDGNETSASFSADGKSIYFVSSRPDGLGGKDIWYCLQNEAGDWGEAVNAGNSVNTKEDEESVFLHPNGSSLFFSSKGHGSTGGYDVFVSHLDTTTNGWAKPINLGSSINTPGDDLYFAMAADEKTAYYSSSKPKALADKDIYRITFGESILTKHVTLVKGFVTGENGLGIESKIVVKEKLTGDIINTIKSNKATGKFLVCLPATGEYQINFTDDNNGTYTEFIEASEKNGYNEVVLNILLEPKYANLFSRVLDEDGNPISKVQIELIDIITKQLIGRFETNSAGASRFSLPFDTKFNIVFNKHGYLFQSVNVSIPKSSGSESKDIKDITMQKVEVGKKIIVNNIFFDFNQEIPQQQSFADLDRIIKLMKDMSSLQLEISGHTDNVGFQDNKKLSEQKAKAVMNYLIGKGCEKSRLKYKGYGSTDPIATNETAEGRQLNSRIELKVIKVDIIAEQAAEEKRIQSGSDIVNSDEVISPYPIINEQENVPENKDSIATANKKDENLDAIKEAFGEEQSQENKETEVADVKKDEKTEDTPVVVEEEKVQENKEPIVADVKKDETTEDTPVVIEEEKIQENKETVVADIKKDEKTEDTPVVIEEEKIQENNETVVADASNEEQKYKERLDSVVNATWGADPYKQVGETKETVTDVKKEEKTEDIPVVIEEEKIAENNETVIAEVKKEEKTEDIPVVVEEEKIAENKETVVADKTQDASKEALLKENQELAKKIEAMEQRYKASLDSVVKASWGNDPNESVEANKTTEIATTKKDENTDTPVETGDEKLQETEEAIVADKKEENSDTAVETTEEQVQENNKTIVADKKETNNSGNFSRHALESYATEKKEEKIKPNKVEIIQEKEEPLVVADKKEENADATEVQSEETKETTTAVNEEPQEVVADKKEETADPTDIVKSEDTKETTTAVNEEPLEVVADKKEEAADPTDIVKSEETKETTTAVNEEPVEVVADKKEETADPTDIVKSEEIKETTTAVNEEPLEVVADKKEETADPTDIVKSEETKETTTAVNDEPLEVVADKKEETADPTDIVKSEDTSEETKETTTAVTENVDPNSSKKESAEVKASTNTSLLPERYIQFDKDENGAITYDEIIKMIDAFFDDAPNVTQEDITSIIDYFFGE
ncbi:MAG: OmpA family protein [Bacteroidota bacterium]